MPLFVGALFEDVVRKETGIHKIIKHDPDSGKPYEKDILYEQYHVGEKIFDCKQQYVFSEIEKHLKKFGLNVIHEESYDPTHIGFLLKNPVTFDALKNEFPKALAAFRELGYSGDVQIYATETFDG